MKRLVAFALLLIAAPALFGAVARISFSRAVPAAHDLGQAEEIAIVSAIGDTDRLSMFLEMFADRVNESNVLRLHIATSGKRDPSDAQLAVKEFTCRTEERTGEGSVLDSTGSKVKRKHVFLDAICTARVDVLAPPDQHRVSSFAIKGEGTSPRVERITDEERAIALGQAVRYAAIDAAEHITPRRVRESILLDDTAPAFAEGMAMIDASQHEQARAIWTEALRKHRDSAALHYNLGAVCEALGDIPAAEKHYIEARRLNPQAQRYNDELKSFLRRNARGQP